jgi:outer membrane protein
MKLSIHGIAAILALSANLVVAQSPKIGYINAARIEKESVLTQQVAEELRKEFAPREQQLQSLQKQGMDLQAQLEKEGDKMPAAERQAKEKSLAAISQQFEKLRRSTAEDLDIVRREKIMRVLEQANAVIKAVAEAGKYDLIVQESVYSSKQLDITDQVLKEIARRAGK